MTKKTISLDGTWSFLHVSNDRIQPAEVRSIGVPGVWQAQFTDLRTRAGIGIYLRQFTLESDWLRERVYLRFGAVFHHAKVWINGEHVGDHEGGFLPFSFDITEALRIGQNEVLVRVESPTDDPAEYSEAPFAEIPFGKQSWYGPLSGIWQSVHLEARVADHIAHVAIRSDPATRKVSAEIRFAVALAAPTRIQMTILAPDGQVAATVRLRAHEGQDIAAADAVLDEVMKWSPRQPNLYRLQVALLRDDEVVDEAEQTFGFRSFEARNGKFYLNGEPFYLRAALDQDYYADTICTPPSVEFLEDQFRKAKELGLNSLRCHIKAPDPRYYEVADRLGLLIWAELPNGGFSTEKSRARKERTLKGMVDRDGNHPSIVCWTIINENWGVDLVHDAEHRGWLKAMYSWLKAYDPSRLVVDNSPLAPSFHVCTDIADYHFYSAFPDSRGDWDGFVDKLASRSESLFSPHGDAVTSGEEPLVCSEFGNWGLPDPGQLADPDGNEPWWFETGHDWGEGVMYAHGIENRFRDWSLDRVFGSLRAFVEAAQWQQFRALKYEIESMRRRPEIAGYVITELTDCNWESNGLLDLKRNPRVFHDVFKTVNSDTVIVPEWRRLAFWDDEAVPVGLAIANGSETVENATLHVSLGESRLARNCELQPGTVTDLGTLMLPLPLVDAGRSVAVSFELRAGERLITSNSLDIAVQPSRLRHPSSEHALWAPQQTLRERLHALGYLVADAMDTADIVVATAHDDEIAAYVRAGGSLLLLPEAEMSLYPFFPHWQNVKIQSRSGSLWSGDWVSSFAWLRRRGEFAKVPGGPLIDATFDRAIPELVIGGCNLLDFQARVHAALVVGWIHKPAALVVERGYGRGRVLVSTFRLFRDKPGADPTATVLLDALIRTVSPSALAGDPANSPSTSAANSAYPGSHFTKNASAEQLPAPYAMAADE